MGYILLGIGAWLLTLAGCVGWFMWKAPDESSTYEDCDPTGGRGQDIKFGDR
jgi:hypothetical protein